MGLFLISTGVVLVIVSVWFFASITPRERWAAMAVFLSIGSSAFVIHAVLWYWGWWTLTLIPLGIAQFVAYKRATHVERLRYWGRA